MSNAIFDYRMLSPIPSSLGLSTPTVLVLQARSANTVQFNIENTRIPARPIWHVPCVLHDTAQGDAPQVLSLQTP